MKPAKAAEEYFSTLKGAREYVKSKLGECLRELLEKSGPLDQRIMVEKNLLSLVMRCAFDSRLDTEFEEKYPDIMRFKIWKLERLLKAVLPSDKLPQRPKELNDWLQVKLVLVYKGDEPIEVMESFVPEKGEWYMTPDGTNIPIVEINRLDEEGTRFRVVAGW